jgi:hypothetical protein
MRMPKPDAPEAGWIKISVDPARGGLLEEKL